jgi:hypothetical protein
MRERKSFKNILAIMLFWVFVPGDFANPWRKFFLGSRADAMQGEVRVKRAEDEEERKTKENKKNSLSSACGIGRGIGFREIVFQNG